VKSSSTIESAAAVGNVSPHSYSDTTHSLMLYVCVWEIEEDYST
jgi:hypothetical protein